jgi:hypothetical protein
MRVPPGRCWRRLLLCGVLLEGAGCPAPESTPPACLPVCRWAMLPAVAQHLRGSARNRKVCVLV